MKLKSKKKLFEFLSTQFHKPDVKIGKYSISDETYGRKSMIYLFNISDVWGVTRQRLIRLLENEGFKVNRRYGKGVEVDLDALEVQVSYFKGYHWDE